MLTRRAAFVLAPVLLTLPGVLVAQEISVPLADRHRGAERVIVGRVAAVNPVWKENEFGDRLIISMKPSKGKRNPVSTSRSKGERSGRPPCASPISRRSCLAIARSST
jgi:hypothetical protein